MQDANAVEDICSDSDVNDKPEMRGKRTKIESSAKTETRSSECVSSRRGEEAAATFLSRAPPSPPANVYILQFSSCKGMGVSFRRECDRVETRSPHFRGGIIDRGPPSL